MIGARENREAEAFDDALRGRRPADAEIAALVRTAELVTASAAVEPTPDFVLSLRAQIMAEAAEVLVAVPKPDRSEVRTAAVSAPRSRVRRRLASLTVVAIAAGGTVGLMSTSAQALPGDMLYPVKRHVESAELALHRSDASRGSFELSQARERLTEATSLAQKGSSTAQSKQLISQALSDFSDQASSGSQDLFAAYGSQKSTALISKVNDFAAASSVHLTQLVALLPAGHTAAYQEAAQTVASLADQASTLCSSCETADLSNLADVVNAITHPKASSSTTKGSGSSSSTSSTTSSTTSATSTKAPSVAPTTPSPTTATTKPLIAPPPTKAPTKLSDVTDPLLGALLGNDDETGLVPGLIDALTGKKN